MLGLSAKQGQRGGAQVRPGFGRQPLVHILLPGAQILEGVVPGEPDAVGRGRSGEDPEIVAGKPLAQFQVQIVEQQPQDRGSRPGAGRPLSERLDDTGPRSASDP